MGPGLKATRAGGGGGGDWGEMVKVRRCCYAVRLDFDLLLFFFYSVFSCGCVCWIVQCSTVQCEVPREEYAE